VAAACVGWGAREGGGGEIERVAVSVVQFLGRIQVGIFVCCSVLQSVLQCIAVCYSVLQCVSVCCSVLQCGFG